MNHQDHVNLIRNGITTHGGVWADLGSGDGAFTLALRDLAGSQVQIYSVDEDIQRLATQKKQFDAQFPRTSIEYINQDFTQPLNLPVLDGIIMANSLHYTTHKKALLINLKKYLKPQGTFILVEYNVDRGNIWVQYPLTFTTWRQIAHSAGFAVPKLLGTIPSYFLKEIYAAGTSVMSSE